MTDLNQAQAQAQAQATIQVPAGFIAVEEKFHFKNFAQTEANRAKVWPSNPDHSITVDENEVDGKKLWKRQTETHTLIVPSVTAMGVAEGPAAAVLQETLTRLMKAAARTLVDAGKTPTQENCSWEIVLKAEHDRLTATGDAKGATFSRDLLKEVAGKIGAFIVAGGGTAQGAELFGKMINSRFSLLACRPALSIMDKIIAKMEDWYTSGCTEAEQVAYADVVEYLIDRANDVTKPAEEVSASAFGV